MNEIKIEIMCDGFRIITPVGEYHVDQEDDPADALSGLFKELGYDVTVEEIY